MAKILYKQVSNTNITVSNNILEMLKLHMNIGAHAQMSTTQYLHVLSPLPVDAFPY